MSEIKGTCLVCDGSLVLPQGTEATEVVLCKECSSRLVVDSINGEQAILSQAPEVEEDWGE